MTLLHTVILGIIEGITEFLPISSTGHLTLTSHLIGVQQTEFVKTFEIVIQLGAILAIVLLYWRTLLQKKDIWLRIITAFIPTGFLGFFLYKYIKGFLIGNELITILALGIGGIVMILIELYHKKKTFNKQDITALSLKQSFLIGIFQSLSMIPGVSRAAASIICAQLLGSSRQSAVEFSFLLAIPTIAAASGYDLMKSSFLFTTEQYITLILGFLISCITALITVKFFLQLIKKQTFISFGIYRILLAFFYWFIILR